MTGSAILITGASSGIGAALAARYAGPGVALVLWGRDEARLGATAERCRARGAVVTTECFDVADLAESTCRLEAADNRTPLGLAIFNAGIGGSLKHDDVAQEPILAARMATINFTAPVVAANLIAPRMVGRGGGRIVLVGSIADSFPLPMAPTYAGTKAGLAHFADALDLRLARFGVRVTLVAPGFVDTPMSQGLTEPRPFLIDAETAAAGIAAGIARGKRRIVVPWQFTVLRTVARLTPRAIIDLVLTKPLSAARPRGK